MSHYLISPVSVVSKWPGPVVTECRQIDLISDTQDWNETTGNWALTGPGPFLERNMKKQTSSAGHKPTRNYLSWAGRPLSVVLTRPRHTLTCIHIFLFLITSQFVITHFDICLHCINCRWKQIWEKYLLSVCLSGDGVTGSPLGGDHDTRSPWLPQSYLCCISSPADLTVRTHRTDIFILNSLTRSHHDEPTVNSHQAPPAAQSGVEGGRCGQIWSRRRRWWPLWALVMTHQWSQLFWTLARLSSIIQNGTEIVSFYSDIL